MYSGPYAATLRERERDDKKQTLMNQDTSSAMCEVRVCINFTHKEDTQVLAGSYMEVVAADTDSSQKVNHEGPAHFQCRGKQVLSVLTKEKKSHQMHTTCKSTTAMIPLQASQTQLDEY